MPEDWEAKIRTVSFTNSVGENVEVEQRAYEAYLQLEADHVYEDYQWWLACGDDGDWDIVSFGY